MKNVNKGKLRNDPKRIAESPIWTVQQCACDGCSNGWLVCTDERLSDDKLARRHTPDELAADPSVQWLHLGADNLVAVES